MTHVFPLSLNHLPSYLRYIFQLVVSSPLCYPFPYRTLPRPSL
nr:MAG TPA: hypothetical protein [Caudoviricetes sp.]